MRLMLFDVHSHFMLNLRGMGRVGSIYCEIRMNLRGMGRVGSIDCLIRMNLRGMGRVDSIYSLVYVIEIRITFMLRIYLSLRTDWM